MFSPLIDFLTRLSFGNARRKKTWKKIATQLRYNVPLNLAFKMLTAQYKKRKNYLLGDMFEKVLINYEHAKNLTTAFVGYAPFDELMLIESAESSGNLAQGFELAVKVVEAKVKIRKALVSALAYPLMLFLLVIVLLIVISTMVIPNFALISDPNTWQGTAYALYLISDLISSPLGVSVGIAFLLFICCIIYSLSHLTGELRTKLDKFPPYSLYRLTVGATWLFTFSTLMKAGKLQIDILENMVKSETSSAYLKDRVQRILDNFIGKKFGEALSLAGMDFPEAELVDDLKVYSELPAFEEKLYTIADEWFEEGIEKIQESAQIFNAICLILITACIGSIIIAFQAIQQSIQQGI